MRQGGRWRESGLLLTLVRGLALVLAGGIFLFLTTIRPLPSDRYLIFGLIAVYTAGRIAYPEYWLRGKRLAYALLIIDILVCCGILFIDNGSNNAFILYPLAVILASAIYFPQKVTYIVATFCSVSAIGSEALPLIVSNSDRLFSEQLYIALMAIYVIVAFLIAWLPYVANINLTATIKHRAIIEERGRLSRELHDGPAQRLALLMMKLDQIQQDILNSRNDDLLSRLDSFKRELQETHLEVREVIDQLRMLRVPENPAMLPALAQYTREFSMNTGIPCHVYLSDGRLDMDALDTVEVLRVVQEALTNVRKHSDASMVEVRFESMANQVKMVIKDNGRGFVPAVSDHHHGLSVMKERVQTLGGKFELLSSPGKGTEIQVLIPLRRTPGGKID